MANRQEKLAKLVDSFGRTADGEFDLAELMVFLQGRIDRVDEAEVYELVRSSSYLFEVWDTPTQSVFLPRRMFFQSAEFRIVPSREEVEGGFLFPGHHFVPFVSREVFPGDLWLVLPDGSAPYVRQVSLPARLALDSLSFFGNDQALEYLESEDPSNDFPSDSALVTAYDLRDFYTQNSFKPGDAIMVRVLDWLQGVFAISTVSENHLAAALDLEKWTSVMRSAYDRMQIELGDQGDCCEQLAVMMLLAREDGSFPVMKTPPQSLSAFVESQDDIVLLEKDGGAVMRTDHGEAAFPDLAAPLDLFFKELGLSCTEAEAEAYMQDARFHGLEDPDAVLARVVKGRALVFKSADDQEEFHAAWSTLWSDVEDFYSRDLDRFGKLRSDLLLLKDQCEFAIQRMDGQEIDPQALSKDRDLQDFGHLSAMLPGLFALLNYVSEDFPESSTGNVDKIASMLLDRLPAVLKKLEAKWP